MTLDTIAAAIEDIKNGKMIIVVDDEGRENEGDLLMAAEKVNAAAINFMVRFARGLVCVPLTAQRLEELKIPMMVNENTSAHCTAFTVSIEARENVTTGISAHDRAHTIKVLVDPDSNPSDWVSPGIYFH